jgi:hypothetical protein
MVQIVKVHPHESRPDLYLDVSAGEITDADKEIVNEILLEELKSRKLRHPL